MGRVEMVSVYGLPSLARERSLRRLNKEGMRFVFKLTTPEEVDAVSITRQRLWTDKRDQHGPFEIIEGIIGHDHLTNSRKPAIASAMPGWVCRPTMSRSGGWSKIRLLSGPAS